MQLHADGWCLLQQMGTYATMASGRVQSCAVSMRASAHMPVNESATNADAWGTVWHLGLEDILEWFIQRFDSAVRACA